MVYLDVLLVGIVFVGMVVLLYGKNFCVVIWKDSIVVFIVVGYWVIVLDQIGFCKFSKFECYQYLFGQFVVNIYVLLVYFGFDVVKVDLVGYLMGGMFVVCYVLMYLQQLCYFVLVNLIGLEDWKVKGVLWCSVDVWYVNEFKISVDSIRVYQWEVYYNGQWKLQYEQWVCM